MAALPVHQTVQPVFGFHSLPETRTVERWKTQSSRLFHSPLSVSGNKGSFCRQVSCHPNNCHRTFCYGIRTNVSIFSRRNERFGAAMAALAGNSGDTSSTSSRRKRKVPLKKTEGEEDDEEEDEEMTDKALNDLFKQLAKDLGEDDIDMDADLTEEEMLQFEKDINRALEAAGARSLLEGDEDSDSDLDEEEEGKERGLSVQGKKGSTDEGEDEDDEDEDFFSYFEDSEDELEDVSVSLDDFDRTELQRSKEVLLSLLEKMEGTVGEQNAKKGGPFSELKWSPKRTKAIKIAASYVQFFINSADVVEEDSSLTVVENDEKKVVGEIDENDELFELDEDEVQMALKVLEQVGKVYERREKSQPGVGDELLANLGVDLDGLEVTSNILEQIMASGESVETSEEGEDLGLLSDEGGDVIDVKATVVDKEVVGVKQLGTGGDTGEKVGGLDLQGLGQGGEAKEEGTGVLEEVVGSVESSIEGGEKDGEGEGEEEDESDNFEVDDYNVEDISVAAGVFDKLLVKMKERKKPGGETLMKIAKELEWTRKVETVVKKTGQMLHHLEEINKEVEDGGREAGGEIEADGEEIQLALDVVDRILEAIEEGDVGGKSGFKYGGEKLCQLLDLKHDELETTAAFLRQIVEEGEEDEEDEEDEEEEGEEEEEEDDQLVGLDQEIEVRTTAQKLESSLLDGKNSVGNEKLKQANSSQLESEKVSGRQEGEEAVEQEVPEVVGISGEEEGQEKEKQEASVGTAALGVLGVAAGAVITGQASSSEKKKPKQKESEEKTSMEPVDISNAPEKPQAVQESAEEDDTRRRVQLSRWQLQKLAAAVKIGRRHVNIRELVGETKLDRRDVLAFLADPPAGLDELDLGLDEEDGEVSKGGQLADKSRGKKTAPTEDDDAGSTTKAGPWTPNVQKDWHGRKRLRKEHLETFEKIYHGSRYPTGSMVQNLVELTHVPRRRILEWFSERREQDRPRSDGRSLNAISPLRSEQS